MIGIEIKNIQDTRAAFTSVFTEAIKAREVICQNGKSLSMEKVSIISTDIFNEILSLYKFNPVFTVGETFGLHEVVIDEIRIYTCAETKTMVIENAIDMIEDFVEDYMENVSTYIQFENHRKKYPYVLRLAHCNSRDEIRRVVFGGDM